MSTPVTPRSGRRDANDIPRGEDDIQDALFNKAADALFASESLLVLCGPDCDDGGVAAHPLSDELSRADVMSRWPGAGLGFWGTHYNDAVDRIPHQGFFVLSKWRESIFNATGDIRQRKKPGAVGLGGTTASAAGGGRSGKSGGGDAGGASGGAGGSNAHALSDQRFFCMSALVSNVLQKAGIPDEELYEPNGNASLWQCATTPKSCTTPLTFSPAAIAAAAPEALLGATSSGRHFMFDVDGATREALPLKYEQPTGGGADATINDLSDDEGGAANDSRRRLLLATGAAVTGDRLGGAPALNLARRRPDELDDGEDTYDRLSRYAAIGRRAAAETAAAAIKGAAFQGAAPVNAAAGFGGNGGSAADGGSIVGLTDHAASPSASAGSALHLPLSRQIADPDTALVFFKQLEQRLTAMGVDATLRQRRRAARGQVVRVRAEWQLAGSRFPADPFTGAATVVTSEDCKADAPLPMPPAHTFAAATDALHHPRRPGAARQSVVTIAATPYDGADVANDGGGEASSYLQQLQQQKERQVQLYSIAAPQRASHLCAHTQVLDGGLNADSVGRFYLCEPRAFAEEREILYATLTNQRTYFSDLHSIFQTRAKHVRYNVSVIILAPSSEQSDEAAAIATTSASAAGRKQTRRHSNVEGGGAVACDANLGAFKPSVFPHGTLPRLFAVNNNGAASAASSSADTVATAAAADAASVQGRNGWYFFSHVAPVATTGEPVTQRQSDVVRVVFPSAPSIAANPPHLATATTAVQYWLADDFFAPLTAIAATATAGAASSGGSGGNGHFFSPPPSGGFMPRKPTLTGTAGYQRSSSTWGYQQANPVFGGGPSVAVTPADVEALETKDTELRRRVRELRALRRWRLPAEGGRISVVCEAVVALRTSIGGPASASTGKGRTASVVVAPTAAAGTSSTSSLPSAPFAFESNVQTLQVVGELPPIAEAVNSMLPKDARMPPHVDVFEPKLVLVANNDHPSAADDALDDFPASFSVGGGAMTAEAAPTKGDTPTRPGSPTTFGGSSDPYASPDNNTYNSSAYNYLASPPLAPTQADLQRKAAAVRTRIELRQRQLQILSQPVFLEFIMASAGGAMVAKIGVFADEPTAIAYVEVEAAAGATRDLVEAQSGGGGSDRTGVRDSAIATGGRESLSVSKALARGGSMRAGGATTGVSTLYGAGVTNAERALLQPRMNCILCPTCHGPARPFVRMVPFATPPPLPTPPGVAVIPLDPTFAAAGVAPRARTFNAWLKLVTDKLKRGGGNTGRNNTAGTLCILEIGCGKKADPVRTLGEKTFKALASSAAGRLSYVRLSSAPIDSTNLVKAPAAAAALESALQQLAAQSRKGGGGAAAAARRNAGLDPMAVAFTEIVTTEPAAALSKLDSLLYDRLRKKK